jgi:hypothetical protein
LSVAMEKLPGFAPLSEMEAMPSAVVPVFDRVKICDELVVPVVTLPKSADEGESVACGAATAAPFPERATVNGDSGWSRSWIAYVELSAPALCGVNVKVTVQVPVLAGMMPLQLSFCVKSTASVSDPALM